MSFNHQNDCKNRYLNFTALEKTQSLKALVKFAACTLDMTPDAIVDGTINSLTLSKLRELIVLTISLVILQFSILQKKIIYYI